MARVPFSPVSVRIRGGMPAYIIPNVSCKEENILRRLRTAFRDTGRKEVCLCVCADEVEVAGGGVRGGGVGS